MVEIDLYDKLHIKFKTTDLSYLRGLKAYFTEMVEGHWWTPQFRSGRWSGEICLFDGRSKTLPYGLLPEVIKFHKKEFPDYKLKISDAVKRLFKTDGFELEFNLNLPPYPYQEESVREILRYNKGIIRVATAGGKSLIFAYILDILKQARKVEKQLIIVPSIILITQLYKDLISYNIESKRIGRWGGGYSECDREITIATWQTLQNNLKDLKIYDSVIVDEVHLAKAKVLKAVLSSCTEAFFRFGFSGTLSENRLEQLTMMSYLGPVIAEYSASYLAEEGYISKCTVHMVGLSYDKKYKGIYEELKTATFKDDFRLSTIADVINSSEQNFLILVSRVQKEGEFLGEYLSSTLKDRTVIFLSGKTPPSEREEWRLKMAKEKKIVLIATYQIFQLGVNIPPLKYVIFASPVKSKIRVLQSIGRALRKHVSKELTGAHIIDLWDQVKILERHGEIRGRFYTKEGFTIKEYSINSQDKRDLDLLFLEIK